METRTLSTADLERILFLMADFGSITYAIDRASAYINAAKHELERFDDIPHGARCRLRLIRIIITRPVVVLSRQLEKRWVSGPV